MKIFIELKFSESKRNIKDSLLNAIWTIKLYFYTCRSFSGSFDSQHSKFESDAKFPFHICDRIFPLPLINGRRSVWVHSKYGRMTCVREMRRAPRYIKSTTRNLARICNLWKYRKLVRRKVASLQLHRSIAKKKAKITSSDKNKTEKVIFIGKKITVSWVFN